MASTTIVASVTTSSGLVCSVDLTRPADISIAVDPAVSTAAVTDDAGARGVRAFHLPVPVAPPAQFGDTSIAVDAGASVNCPVASICFHSCVTHTECVGHMLPGRVTLYDIPRRRYGRCVGVHCCRGLTLTLALTPFVVVRAYAATNSVRLWSCR